MKKTNTRRALLMSCLSLLLCVSMLVGTTFAWFTDSVESGKNTILAGNLDIELEYADDPGNDSWKTVKGASDIIDPNALWEPGRAEVVYLRISNLGSLALKYQFAMNIIGETVGKTEKNEDIRLSEHLRYGIVDVTEKFASRAAAIAAVENDAVKLSNYVINGEMEAKAPAKVMALVVYMPTTVGNEANYRGETIPAIELGLSLFATQKMSEEDSFGKDYDAGAILPWDGSIGDVPAEKDGIITIYTAEELAAFAASVNAGTSYAGKTVKLAADIDLANIAWTPIGACNTPTYFQGTFDGQGNTIYNLNIDKSTDEYMYSTAGLFGWVDTASATVKNVNVDGAIVKGSHWVGVIAGYWTGEISNCSVNDAVVIGYNVNGDANGDKIGGIVGYLNKGTLNGNTITASTVTGHRDVGGMAGAVVATGTVTNNTVKDVTVSASYGQNVGAIVSPRTAVVVDDTNKAINVSMVTIANVANNDALKEALTADKENIIVNLTGDMTYQVSSWQTFAMGTANTKTITINGNGNVLTFDLRDSDWSHVTTSGAKLVLNDVKIQSAGYNSGHWKRNGIAFACELELNDVTTTPIILKNNAQLNDVVINGGSGVYGLWICSSDIDVAVDGLTVNCGRGIKIADEDVSSVAAIDLSVKNAKFNTSAKAAVLATSTAGANIKLENVDISGCAADSTHAVWVDEDRAASYANVTVDGGKKFLEDAIIDSNSDLASAVAGGATTIYLANGEYDLNGNQRDGLTIIGLGDAVKVENTTKYAGGKAVGAIWQKINLENVTVTNTVYTMADGGQSTFKNVTFEKGVRQAYGTGVVFENCTFGSNSEGYALHFQSDDASAGGNIRLTGCKFLGGKVHLGGKRAYTFTGCDFAAGTDFQVWSDITLNGCTVGDVQITAENLNTLFPNLNKDKVTI